MTAAFFYKWRNVIHKISNLWMGISIFFIILLPLSIGLGLVLKSLPIMEDYSFSSLILAISILSVLAYILVTSKVNKILCNPFCFKSKYF